MELAALLHHWAMLIWSEDQRPALQRLEQAIAVWPVATTLNALARMQARDAPAGSFALQQLAAAAPERHRDHGWPRPPDHSAFWELPGHRPDRCFGPQCRPCIEAFVQPGTQQLNAHGRERRVAVIPEGQAWLRPPTKNAWMSTHAIGVADGQGVLLDQFCDRYPIPWPGVCPYPKGTPEPLPQGQPQRVDRPVVVMAGLSE